MEVGLGLLGWTPHAFWAATPRELWAAYDGWRRVRGFDTPAGVVRGEFEAMKRRFPDRERRRIRSKQTEADHGEPHTRRERSKADRTPCA